jgi:hypothetical protein
VRDFNVRYRRPDAGARAALDLAQEETCGRLSEARIGEWRCFDVTDTMNNLSANSGLKPKNIIADVDTHRKGPEDNAYANFPVNYLKIDKTPGADKGPAAALGLPLTVQCERPSLSASSAL